MCVCTYVYLGSITAWIVVCFFFSCIIQYNYMPTVEVKKNVSIIVPF